MKTVIMRLPFETENGETYNAYFEMVIDDLPGNSKIVRVGPPEFISKTDEERDK